MRKALTFFLPPILVATAIFFAFQYFILRPADKGALQVTASPDSAVYLNGKYVGQTPLCKCPNPEATGKESSKDLLQAGDYAIKIVPSDKAFSSYTDNITIRKSLLTVVDRKFAEGAKSEGSIISLLPLPDASSSQILVTSIPDKTEVLLDDLKAGTAPLLIKDVTPTKHDLRIRKDGYKEKIIPLLGTKGYKLMITAYLGINDELTPSVTPTSSPSATPSPTLTSESTVTVLETPTGFLRVREDASVAASEIDRVTPGQKLPYVDEVTGWYKVHLPSGKEGWISSQYANKE
jgi:hypothetical protein